MTTATTTWPSASEQDDAFDQLESAQSAIDALHLRFLALTREGGLLHDEEWDRLPSLEAVGRLYRNVIYARYDVKEIGKNLDEIADVLKRAAWMTGEREGRDDAN